MEKSENQLKIHRDQSDIKYMKIAITLAKKGIGQVNPNPMVGAVIVKNNKIIGWGWHEKFGTLHAERNAMARCQESMEGATIYVTLEPCCHYGKTPPCTEAIIQSGIKRVVVGSLDPNPQVNGKGIEQLKSQKIEVTVGVLEEECKIINEVFFHFIQTKRPYLICKYAMTMDGKIATATGKSKWITGEIARKRVHEDRSRYMAIMVGVDTVLVDDPMLTCRLEQKRSPIRIVCDTRLRTPIQSRLVQSAKEGPLIIATSIVGKRAHKPYLNAGATILEIPKKGKHLDLQVLMDELGQMQIDSIFLEGGGTLNWSALENQLVNKVQAYIAPKLFGGVDGKAPIGGRGIMEPSEAYVLKNCVMTQLGDDLLIESEVSYHVYGVN